MAKKGIITKKMSAATVQPSNKLCLEKKRFAQPLCALLGKAGKSEGTVAGTNRS